MIKEVSWRWHSLKTNSDVSVGSEAIGNKKTGDKSSATFRHWGEMVNIHNLSDVLSSSSVLIFFRTSSRTLMPSLPLLSASLYLYQNGLHTSMESSASSYFSIPFPVLLSRPRCPLCAWSFSLCIPRPTCLSHFHHTSYLLPLAPYPLDVTMELTLKK